jgi:hypothetical protein
MERIVWDLVMRISTGHKIVPDSQPTTSNSDSDINLTQLKDILAHAIQEFPNYAGRESVGQGLSGTQPHTAANKKKTRKSMVPDISGLKDENIQLKGQLPNLTP